MSIKYTVILILIIIFPLFLFNSIPATSDLITDTTVIVNNEYFEVFNVIIFENNQDLSIIMSCNSCVIDLVIYDFSDIDALSLEESQWKVVDKLSNVEQLDETWRLGYQGFYIILLDNRDSLDNKTITIKITVDQPDISNLIFNVGKSLDLHISRDLLLRDILVGIGIAILILLFFFDIFFQSAARYKLLGSFDKKSSFVSIYDKTNFCTKDNEKLEQYIAGRMTLMKYLIQKLREMK
ncbi:MAG: hypothetical protein ACXAC7_09095 [Candidatus Hodarchaeales archaeon]